MIARVVGQDLFAKLGAVDVCVDLGRGDIGMTEHISDGEQVSSAFE